MRRDGASSLPRACRREVLGVAAALLCAWLPMRAKPFAPFGPVKPPQVTPPLDLLLLDSRTTNLASVLRGKVTAMQLMFTSCSATCPIQGAIFAEAQRRLSDAPSHFQLLSLSIDPLGDDPKALRAWLQRFGADPARWSAALTTTKDVDRLLDFVRGRARGVDRHTPQVYVFDREARLYYRSADLPPAASVVELMRSIAAQG